MNIRNGQTNMRFFHVSENEELHTATIYPKVPNNTLTETGNEDGTTSRICFAPSIDQCLMAMCNSYGVYHIYEPELYGKTKVVEDTRKYVPDATYTNEIWVTTETKLKKIGSIYVYDYPDWEGKFTLEYPVNGKRTGEVMSWYWKGLN